MIVSCPSCGRKNRLGAAHVGTALESTAKGTAFKSTAFKSSVRCGACKTILPPIAQPIDADVDVFDDAVRSSPLPVLVDFWAEWCGPCRMAAPEVKKVAAALAGRAIVLKVDTERHPELAARYNVRGIPNFAVFRNGRLVSQHAGVAPAREMQRWLEAAATA